MKLKELRKEKGISQLKLAMDLSMNQNTISRYETEERQADYETLIKIADYFNVSIDYLWGARKTELFLNSLKSIKAAANLLRFAAACIILNSNQALMPWQPFRRIFLCFP